jgi:hypothetical protein
LGLEDGFTAFVGVNNSGKSSLLRFVHEIRPVLDYLRDSSGFASLLAAGECMGVNFQSLADNSEVFHNGNDRPIMATFALEGASEEEPSAVKLTWRRDLILKTRLEWRGSLGFDVHVLERRALENYLPDHAVKKAKGEKYSGLDEYERLGAAQPAWGKNENWRIAAKMTRDDLFGTDLEGFFLTLAESVAPR